MTRKHFIHKRTRTKYLREKSAEMNKARWDAERVRRDDNQAERIAELQEIERANLPRKQGDMLGTLQWFDARTGQCRRWVVRIGDRIDRITVESPHTECSKSHGWTWFLTNLRKKLA